MLFVRTYVICCCKCLLLLVTLYRQDISCDQQDRLSSPRWGLCLPLPAASRGVIDDAGLGCNGDHSPLHQRPNHPEQTPGTFIAALRMGTIRLDHGNLGTGVGGMGLSQLVGISCDGEQTPAGTLPQQVPILPPPPPTPAVPPHPLPCCLQPPHWEGALTPHLPKAGGKDGKLHTTVSSKLPAHLRSILPLHPRAFSPTLRCCYKDISGSKEVNVCGRRRRGRGKRFP